MRIKRVLAGQGERLLLRAGAVRFLRASRWQDFILWRLETIALVMPWNVCYVRTDTDLFPELINHEMVHFEQMDRDGRIVFCVRYLWQLLTVGYWNIDYEVEAMERELDQR